MEKNYKISLLFDFYGALLSSKQRIVIESYYNSDYSLSEIAQEMGISRQGVRDTIKRAEQSLLNMEAKLGLYSRFTEMTKELEQIKNLSKEVIDLIDDQTIKNKVSVVLELAQLLLEKQE